MIIKTGTKNGLDIVTGLPGDKLDILINECVYLYDRVILDFNGVERIISKGSNLEMLYKYWFDMRYDNLLEDRDIKISEILK